MSGYFRAYSNRVREASRELPERELRVYLALLSYANCEGMCWPGIKCLVDTTGIHTDGIYSALEALVAQKYIIIVRTGTRDLLTRQQLPNVYKIDGAVIDDDCADDEFRTDDPILFQGEKKNRNTTIEQTHKHNQNQHNQITPPPTQPIFSEVEVPKTKTTAKTEKTPTRSVNTNSPERVPRNFYTGPLVEFAAPLPGDDEQIVDELRAIDARMTIRTARYLVASRGAARAKWAIGHYHKQSNVFNPAGYLRALIEREAVEEVDAEEINPGLMYITGKYAEYIDH